MEELIIRNREFKENVIQVINKAQLPAFIVRSILKELIEQVSLLEQQQYEEAQRTVRLKNSSKNSCKNNKSK